MSLKSKLETKNSDHSLSIPDWNFSPPSGGAFDNARVSPGTTLISTLGTLDGSSDQGKIVIPEPTGEITTKSPYLPKKTTSTSPLLSSTYDAIDNPFAPVYPYSLYQSSFQAAESASEPIMVNYFGAVQPNFGTYYNGSDDSFEGDHSFDMRLGPIRGEGSSRSGWEGYNEMELESDQLLSSSGSSRRSRSGESVVGPSFSRAPGENQQKRSNEVHEEEEERSNRRRSSSKSEGGEEEMVTESDAPEATENAEISYLGT